jgi:hypothetical protein
MTSDDERHRDKQGDDDQSKNGKQARAGITFDLDARGGFPAPCKEALVILVISDSVTVVGIPGAGKGTKYKHGP